ncbi:MAG TPA: hypothetical protein VF306_23730 [Pirellulales bacterium]
MDASAAWRQFFQNWPEGAPTRGVLVTRDGEQLLFDGLMVSDSMLLIERKTPDTTGARKVLLAYEDVAALKFVDVVKAKTFESAGFAGKIKD